MTPSTFSQFVTNTESPTLQRYLGVDEDTKRRMLDILRCGREVEHSQQSLNHAIHTITVRTAIAAVEWLKESSPDRHPTFQLVLQWCLNVTDLTKVGEDIKEKRLTEAVRMTIRAREGYQEWMQEVQDFKVNAWTDIHPQILAIKEKHQQQIVHHGHTRVQSNAEFGPIDTGSAGQLARDQGVTVRIPLSHAANSLFP
jgi:hypothetical protein